MSILAGARVNAKTDSDSANKPVRQWVILKSILFSILIYHLFNSLINIKVSRVISFSSEYNEVIAEIVNLKNIYIQKTCNVFHGTTRENCSSLVYNM